MVEEMKPIEMSKNIEDLKKEISEYCDKAKDIYGEDEEKAKEVLQQLYAYFAKCWDIITRSDIAKEVKKIKEKFPGILEEMSLGDSEEYESNHFDIEQLEKEINEIG